MDRDPHLSGISGWDTLTAVGMSVLAFFYVWVLPRLPDPVPTHFDAQGRVNGWTDKAHLPWVVFGVPVLFWALLWGIGWLTSRMERDQAKARAAAFQPMRGFLGLGMSLLMVGCLAASWRGVFFVHLGAAAVFICLALGVVFMTREVMELLKDQPDAGHYRWGIIYRNPDDPRLWVEKRVGMGRTLNYAHRSAWWVTVLLVLMVVAGAWLVIFLRQ